MYRKFLNVLKGLSLVSLCLLMLAVLIPASAHADPKSDASGVKVTVVKDKVTEKLFVNFDLTESPVGLDDYAWTTHVKLSSETATSSVQPWVVPQQAVNLIEVDAVTGVIKWQIFSDDYLVAWGSVNLADAQIQVVDLYTQAGYYHLNGRDWVTTCEPYSQTFRCRTDIQATQTTRAGNVFTSKTGWVFNNLTYAASSRSLWKENPLGHTTKWISEDGRFWSTECDTALTGRNGCRSFIEAEVIQVSKRADGTMVYGATLEWVFNNIVQFK